MTAIEAIGSAGLAALLLMVGLRTVAATVRHRPLLWRVVTFSMGLVLFGVGVLLALRSAG